MATINGTAGNDTLSGTSDDDIINGLDGNDTLSGLGGNDALNGGIGNDALNGGTGADTMTGGAGNDTYTVDNAGDVVTENAGEGTDVVSSSISYTLGANVENLSLTGTAAINATGNSLNNQLTGNSAANVMAGGLGNDGYYITAGDTVIENAGEGTDYVLSTISYALTANVENLTLVGTAANNGTGNELNNVIAGNTAANVLDGGAGTDNMSGGLGDDTYVVDSTGDVVTEAASAGIDSVQASASFTLGANVENLTLTGISAINGTGNTLNNIITGNGAANTLIGGAGNDTLAGAVGNDVYRFDAGFGVDTIADADATPGNLDIIRFETTIVAASVFAVRSGLNLLLTQGANSITVQNWYASDANKIERVEFLADGTAWDATQLRAMTNFAPSVQNPIADQEAGPDVPFNFVVPSNAFADADAVIGDTLTYTATLADGSALPTWLGFDAFTRTFSGTPTGSDIGALDVKVVATDSAGATVFDTFSLNVLGDLVLTGTPGNDTLTGNSGNDTISGLGGNDTLTGQAGNDYLDGGPGADTMIGGPGDDTFIVDDAGDIAADAPIIRRLSTPAVDTPTFSGGGKAVITGDGRFVAFESGASNLVPGDTNNAVDVFVRDIQTGTIERVSVDEDGTQTLSGSDLGGISDDGRYVVFASYSNALVPGDTNGRKDVFVKDNITETVDLISIGTGGVQGNMDSYVLDLSPDGRYVLISSAAFNLVVNDTNFYDDVFVVDRSGGTVSRVSVASDGTQGNNTSGYWAGGFGSLGSISADGRYAAFGSLASNLVAADTNNGTDVFVKDTLTGNMERVSVAADGTQTNVGSTSTDPSISSDGRYIAFRSSANNLVAGDTNGRDDIFVKDRATGIVERISIQTDGTQFGVNSDSPSISGDGRFVGFHAGSAAYIVDRYTDVLESIVVTAYGVPGAGGSSSGAPNISSDGRYAVFASNAALDSNDTNGLFDVYVTSNPLHTLFSGGADTVNASISHSLLLGIENLTLIGAADINGTGNGLANQISGNTGNNQLDGGLGADTMSGGFGNDAYVVDNSGDAVVENPGEGDDTVQTGITYILSDNVENLTITGSAAINGTGNNLDNLLVGNVSDNLLLGLSGADTLVGGDGNDTLVGGAGNDLYVFDIRFRSDLVIDSDSTIGNLDTIRFGAGIAPEDVSVLRGHLTPYDLILHLDYFAGAYQSVTVQNWFLSDADRIERVEFADGPAVWDVAQLFALSNKAPYVYWGILDQNAVYGTTFVFEVPGNAFVDVDSMIGDSLTFSATLSDGSALPPWLGFNPASREFSGIPAAGDVGLVGIRVTATDSYGLYATDDFFVTVSVPSAITGTPGNDTLTGTIGDDIINGLGGHDSLHGLAGNDRLDGGIGFDSMAGGPGNDTYVVDQQYESVVEALDEGIDAVEASASFLLPAHTENLVLLGVADLSGTGNSLANSIIGNSGNNSLDGGAGVDYLAGKAGNDTYVVDNTGDLVVEAIGEGIDDLGSSVTYSLPTNVENLTLIGGLNIDGNGNELDNILVGNEMQFVGDGANTLTGGIGNDVLDGRSGPDILIGGSGNDTYHINDSTGGPTSLLVRGEPGHWRIPSEVHSFNADEGLIEAGGGDWNLDGDLDAVWFTFYDNLYPWVRRAEISFSTGGLGGNLAVGSYVISGSALPHAGLNFTFDGVGESADFGGFTVHALDVDYSGSSPVLTSFSASFEHRINTPGSPAAFGAVNYNYSLAGPATPDAVIEGAGEGTDTVFSSLLTYTLPDNVENLTLSGSQNSIGTGNVLDNSIIGNSGSNQLAGGDGSDVLSGGVGEDLLDGGAGLDTLIGGIGNDTYLVNDLVTDIIVENPDEGSDTVLSDVDHVLQANVDALTLTGMANLNGTGNSGHNLINGNSGDNRLIGDLGSDRLLGAAGSDVLDGGGDLDTLQGESGDDIYVVADAVVTGGTTSLTMVSQPGDFIGQGLTYSLNNSTGTFGAPQLLDFGLDGLIDSIRINYVDTVAGDTVSYFSLQFETTRLGTNLTPGLYPFAKSYYDYSDLNAPGMGVDGNGRGTGGNLFGSFSIESLAIEYGGSTPVLRSFVVSFEQHISDPAGPALFGTLNYHLDSVGPTVTDAVFERFNEGNDTVMASVSYALTANVENLTLTGINNINGTGNILANVITGNTGDNVLTGGLGNDVYALNAGFGVDTVIDTDGTPGNADVIRFGTGIAPGAVSASRSGQSLVLTNGANSVTVQNWYLSATDKIEQVEFVDDATVWGVAQLLAMTNIAPTIAVPIVDQSAAAGVAFGFTVASNAFTDADAVIGDTLTYSATRADDTALPSWLTFNPATRAFSGTPGGGDVGVLNVKVTATDGIGASVSDIFDLTVGLSPEINGTAGPDVLNGTANVDIINGLAGNDTLNGLGGNDVLNGGADNDTLNGGTGADTMTGGAGNDTYTVDDTSDVVIENAGEGTDVVNSSVSYTLSANVENISLTGGAAINATGNNLNNQLTGNSAANVLAGGAGNDGYLVGAGDTVIENAGEGTADYVLATVSFALSANIENLTLAGGASINGTGNESNNTLTGNAGANVLNGGAGADTMTGGAGMDTFRFDVLPSPAGIDRITDFVVADDTIQFENDIFASFANPGVLAANLFRSGAGVTSAADEDDYLIYNTTSGALYYDADGPFNGFSAQQVATLTGLPPLTADDFFIT